MVLIAIHENSYRVMPRVSLTISVCYKEFSRGSHADIGSHVVLTGSHVSDMRTDMRTPYKYLLNIRLYAYLI